MKTKSFLLAWSSAFVVCFALGYLWHDEIMTNFYTEHFERQQNPDINVSVTAIAYLIITFLMTLIYSVWHKGKNPLIEGLLLGLIVGILWSLPAPLLDIAFGVGITPSGILFDSAWQMIEEGIGGVVLARVYQFSIVQRPEKSLLGS